MNLVYIFVYSYIRSIKCFTNGTVISAVYTNSMFFFFSRYVYLLRLVILLALLIYNISSNNNDIVLS